MKIAFVTKQFTMEEVLSRFPLIGEEIFVSLDEGSLKNCKKVCKTWKNFIEDPNQNFMWIQSIQEHENNAIVKDTKWEKEFPLKTFIGGPKPNWSKLQIQELKEFVNELNSEKDESKLNEMFVEKYAKLKVELNAKIQNEMTIFHFVCREGQLKMANLLMKKYSNLKIDLNARCAKEGRSD